MSRAHEYLDNTFARLEQHKDDKWSSHHGVEPTVEAVAVVWPPAPEAERLSLLMRAKITQKAEFRRLKDEGLTAGMHPSRNAMEHRGAAK